MYMWHHKKIELSFKSWKRCKPCCGQFEIFSFTIWKRRCMASKQQTAGKEKTGFPEEENYKKRKI